MFDKFTCAFFGHRDFCEHIRCENKLSTILRDLLQNNEYVEFLVGRNGEFDMFVSSTIRQAKKLYCDDNSVLVCILPYVTAEYINNREYFEAYYDEIEICEKSCIAHYKVAMQIRNREMVERADMIICYIDRKSGGAYQSISYAEKQGKTIINLAADDLHS